MSGMEKSVFSRQEAEAWLCDAQVGRLVTLDEEGFPYTTPVHFVLHQGKVYVHGRASGRKMDNIRRDNRVGFEADAMDHLVLSDKPCSINTAFVSVIAQGRARLVEDPEAKLEVLRRIVAKYTPQLADKELPSAAVRGTAVIEIELTMCSGKSYAERPAAAAKL